MHEGQAPRSQPGLDAVSEQQVQPGIGVVRRHPGGYRDVACLRASGQIRNSGPVRVQIQVMLKNLAVAQPLRFR